MPASPNKPSPAAAPAPETHATFESAMARLEAIVGQMENSRLPLEDLIRCYEEGTRLVAVCTERLSAAEQRIELITRDAAGARRTVEVTAASIAAEAAASGEPAPPPRSSRDVRATPDDATASAAAANPPPSPAGRAALNPKNRNEVSLF